MELQNSIIRQKQNFDIELSSQDFAALSNKWGIKHQRYCYLNIENALRRKIPPLVGFMKTYGEKNIRTIIAGHLSDAIVKLGEDSDMDSFDVEFAVQAILDNRRARVLNFSSIIGFFYLLKSGELEIFGKITPRKILEQFNKYIEKAGRREDEIYRKLEHENNLRDREEWAKNAVSYEQYAKNHNIDTEKYPTMAEYIIAVVSDKITKK